MLAAAVISTSSKTSTTHWELRGGYRGVSVTSGHRQLHEWERELGLPANPSSRPYATRAAAMSCPKGSDADYDRPNFDLPGSPHANVTSAASCQQLCQLTRACRQWAWNSEHGCWLKNLVGPRAPSNGFCSGLRIGSGSEVEHFPIGNFTPFSYLQQPHHRVRHTSGHLRSDDSLNGLGYHYPWYGGNGYRAILSVSARPNGLTKVKPLFAHVYAHVCAHV